MRARRYTGAPASRYSPAVADVDVAIAIYSRLVGAHTPVLREPQAACC
jgi:hypothetical protein